MKKKINIVNSNKERTTIDFIKLIQRSLSFVFEIEFESISEEEFINLKHADKTRFYLYIVGEKGFDSIQDISYKVRELGLKTIFISSVKDDLILGPTYYPNLSASLDSAYFSYLNYKVGRTPTFEELTSLQSKGIGTIISKLKPAKINAFLKNLLDEVQRFLLTTDNFKFIDHISFYGKKNSQTNKYIFPIFEQISNDSSVKINRNEYLILRTQWLNSKKQIRQRNFFSSTKPSSENSYSSVGVIGGGTSGYLTALALKKRYPDLPVTLIESSKIPIIGVGEATTPNILNFLFDTLGFDKNEFLERVKPTCKLGIKFDWGNPNEYYNFPFGIADILASYLNQGDINSCSLSSMLMSNDSSLVVGDITGANGDVQLESLTNSLQHAYHINNKDFVYYLREKAAEMQIELIDDLIVECHLDQNKENLNIVYGENGKYQYDFYVDCTGFKSLLLEKVMGSKFVSYGDALLTNCAITAKMPNGGIIKPYTYSETMKNGWCWTTPVRNEDHLGYVFSKNHCTESEAITELTEKYPNSTILNTVHFRSGRHEKVLVGNVFAVGNSFAFVEPLESTGIHMIIKEINYLVDNFKEIKKSDVIRDLINTDIRSHWDYLKFFLAIHFKFNKKLSTSFWQDCNNINLSEYQWVIDVYKKCGPLNYLDNATKKMIRKRLPDSLFGLGGIDCILMGQAEFPDNFMTEKLNEKIWNSNIKVWEKISNNTVSLVDGNQFSTK